MNLKIDLNPPSDKIPAEAAARLLNCSAQTLRRMMQRGELRAYHVGRRTFYLCEEIENLFKPFLLGRTLSESILPRLDEVGTLARPA